jgi:dihydrofolate reductase
MTPRMRQVIYAMSVSLDGYITGPDGEIDWTAPDEELHRFHNERTRELGTHICGRRLYEEMLYWETADQDPALGDVGREFAGIWQELPKLVFSMTLTEVQGNTRLATEGIAEEVARLKREPGGDIGLGGARLAAAFVELDLIDEYQLFVYPVIVGGGTPFLPATPRRLDLELVETRTFGSRVVLSRYRRARASSTPAAGA